MFNLLSLLATILTGLRATIAQVALRGRARSPMVTPPSDHLDRMFACFERLYADWCHGILPEPREHADLSGADAARRSRPVLPDPILPDPIMTAPQLPPSAAPATPPPSASPHPPLPAPCAPLLWMPSPSPPTTSKNAPEPCMPTHVLIVTI